MDWSKQFVSGRDINGTIFIGLFDDNDQQYNIDSNSECQFFTEDIKVSIGGNTKVKAEKGIY